MDTTKVFCYRNDLDNKAFMCNLGCKHFVTYHEVKTITVVSEHEEMVPFLGYDKAEMGTIREAVDYQGRKYTFTPVWDGQGSWKREDGKYFSPRPVLYMDMAFDLAGNRLARNGKRL